MSILTPIKTYIKYRPISCPAMFICGRMSTALVETSAVPRTGNSSATQVKRPPVGQVGDVAKVLSAESCHGTKGHGEQTPFEIAKTKVGDDDCLKCLV
jgi:hypothetical protein